MKLTAGYLDKKGIEYTVAADGYISVGGYLDLRGTQITALPDNLSVGSYLDLRGTQITALPDNLSVGGSLYLRGTQITALPDNLSVGGSLDLEGTQITALPDNLSVGGPLDLEGTQITALPDNLSVGGSLYLRGTQITALPDNLSVGGSLYLRGTQITALPDNLSVGGYLDLRGTQITALPDGLSAEKIYFKGNLGGHLFAVFDGEPAIILSSKKRDDVTIHHCISTALVNGESTGEKFFVAEDENYSAHGKTIREALEELAFKGGERDVSEYENMPPKTKKTPEDWALVYRMCTGACRFGVNEFMKSKKLKKQYTLTEIIEETRGAYGHEQFLKVVGQK